MFHENQRSKDLLSTLQSINEDQFPNIRSLLVIGCTLPVGSSTAERSFSALRRIKNYMRSYMNETRLTGLTLMHLNNDIDIDLDKIVKRFIQSHPRRLFNYSVLFDLD